MLLFFLLWFIVIYFGENYQSQSFADRQLLKSDADDSYGFSRSGEPQKHRAAAVKLCTAAAGRYQKKRVLTRLPIFSRQWLSWSISWNFAPKAMDKFGFWCAGLMAQPTKKRISVA